VDQTQQSTPQAGQQRPESDGNRRARQRFNTGGGHPSQIEEQKTRVPKPRCGAGGGDRRSTSRSGSGCLGTEAGDGDESCFDDDQIPTAMCRRPRTIPAAASSTATEDEWVVETQQIPEVETMRRPTAKKPKTNSKKKATKCDKL
jgi:hypothetical protein